MARTKQRQTARKSTGSWSQSTKYTTLMKKLETKTGKGTGKGRKSTASLFQYHSKLTTLSFDFEFVFLKGRKISIHQKEDIPL